jgi:hypothetical protein
MKTIVTGGLQQKTRLFIANMYPVAGIVGIITYLVAACVLE